MKEVPRAEWAIRLLSDQVDRLPELRNANPRDAGFKLWRQTTLTVIQRIWPGDLARSERFRRIPFSPSTATATRAQAKDHYEKGCAEAATYLRNLVAEIETRGVEPPDPRAAPSKPASLPPELAGKPRGAGGEIERAFDPRDLFEPSPLMESSPGAPPEETAAEEPPAPPAASMPSRPARGRATPPPAPAAPAGPAARAAPAKPSPHSPTPHGPRRTDRRALKEMLGFLDDSSLLGQPPSQETHGTEPEAALEPLVEPAPPRPAFGMREEPSEDTPHEDSAYGEIPSASGPDYDEAESSEEEEEGLQQESEEEADPEILLPDFLTRATSARPSPPASRPPAPPAPSTVAESHRARGGTPTTTARAHAPIQIPTGPAAPRTPAATALTTLAGEVARLGVPEAEAASARATLLDLARQLDDETATWDSIREFLRMVADYPRLAQRAIPLLVPYLDVV